MLQYNDSFCCCISNRNISSVYWLIQVHSMATILWIGSMSCGGTWSRDTLMRHKYGHIWQYHVSHPLHREVSLPSPVRYVMSTSAGASGGIKRGGNPVRVSANGCPSEQDNEDILVDVLGLLSSEFGVVPLGLARSYAATSCEEVARASPHSKAGLYWITDGSNTAHQEYCNF